MTVLLIIALTFSPMRVECGNQCVNTAEASGLCNNETEDCAGDIYQKCLDDCDTMETYKEEFFAEHDWECTTDTECLEHCLRVVEQEHEDPNLCTEAL